MAWLIDVFEGGRELIWDREPDRGPTPARDAHVGALFRAQAACAECMYDAPVVFTAEHGFIHLDTMIGGPYDPAFARPGVVSIATIRQQVRDQELDRCHGVTINVDDPHGRALAAAAFEGTQVDVAFADERTVEEVIRVAEECANRCSG